MFVPAYYPRLCSHALPTYSSHVLPTSFFQRITHVFLLKYYPRISFYVSPTRFFPRITHVSIPAHYQRIPFHLIFMYFYYTPYVFSTLYFLCLWHLHCELSIRKKRNNSQCKCKICGKYQELKPWNMYGVWNKHMRRSENTQNNSFFFHVTFNPSVPKFTWKWPIQ